MKSLQVSLVWLQILKHAADRHITNYAELPQSSVENGRVYGDQRKNDTNQTIDYIPWQIPISKIYSRAVNMPRFERLQKSQHKEQASKLHGSVASLEHESQDCTNSRPSPEVFPVVGSNEWSNWIPPLAPGPILAKSKRWWRAVDQSKHCQPRLMQVDGS